MSSRLEEVRFGERQEQAILRRWMPVSRRAAGADRVIKSRPFQDFDFLALAKDGFPLAYLEIKVRRVRLAEFGDAVAPIRKHDYAKRLHEQHRVPFLMIVQYACGSLVEIDLAEPPAAEKALKRRDRKDSVPHGFWRDAQLTVVLDGAEQDVA